MIDPFYKYKKALEEISEIEERYYSVVFSKLNINEFEKVLDENFLYYQEGMAERYRRDKMYQCFFQAVWLIFFFCVGARLLEICTGFQRCAVMNNGFLMGVLIIAWLILGEVFAIKIIHKMSPLSTLIERQAWFALLVKIDYYPIFEFQEKLKNHTVKCFRLKPFQAVMELEYEDEMGNTRGIQMEVPKSCIEHWEESTLDFSFLDQIVMEKAERVGIRFEDL